MTVSQSCMHVGREARILYLPAALACCLESKIFCDGDVVYLVQAMSMLRHATATTTGMGMTPR